MPRRESRLAQETSPYLLQHVNNPVDWYAWGPEALERAQAENKPILLSIGYSSCHYCHVMERESFQNESTAKLMNDSFVCIKVDREERPDIDDVYMKATVAMNGSGGWPMTVFLTPEGAPFFAGTYFPPEDREGRIGFPRLLTQLAELWKTKRDDLQNQAAELSRHVQAQFQSAPGGALSEESIRVAARRLSQEFDSSFGGFGGAPKFPPAPALALLLRYHLTPGQEESLNMVTRTLDGMMTGGVFDQLGGGFFRYSVDQKWLVPHFEKMLYDNAELSKVYIQAFQATGHDPYRRVACETLDFVLREMQSPQGGFFSSMDADSENQEGAYYLWTREQVSQVLDGKSTTAFCEFYGVQEEGPLAGANVLTTRRSFSNVAKELGLPEDELVSSLETARTQMLEARAGRVAPAVDDKVLASYNGLFISALVDGARAFGDARYLEAAVRAAEFLLAPGEDGSGLRKADGGLLRSSRAGRSHIDGFLDDYAFVAEALLKLYEIGAGIRYLTASRELCDRMLKDFWDHENGAFFSTSPSHEQLFARGRDAHDGAIPHPNAVACQTLTRLSVHTGNRKYRDYAVQITQAFAGAIKRAPRAHCGLLLALDSLLQPPLEVVLSGSPDSENWKELAAVLGSRFLPYRVEARVTRSSDLSEEAPLTQGRFTEDAEPQVYLCRDHVCSAPALTPESLATQLDQAADELRRLRQRELGFERLKGRATPEATAARAQASPLIDAVYEKLQDLTVSKVGLGSYRIGLDQPKHREAVRHALLSGINLIDSSPTFALGDSERLIGQVLSELCANGQFKREEVVLISKVGVAQGSEAEGLEARRKAGPLSFTVPLKTSAQSADDADSLHAGAFSLDPDFIRAQIRGSLERLGVEHLDVCLIQSPEHLLASGQSQEQMQEAIAQAFTTLEAEVEAGRIGRYGVFTNTTTLAPEELMHVDLGELLKSTRKAPHFKVLALPLNVIETAALEPAAGQSDSNVKRATDAGLSLLACRPLSAMIGGALLRLAEPPASEDGGAADALSASRYKVASLEAEFETTLAAQLRLAKRAGQEAILPLSGALGQAVEQVKTRQQFELAEATLLTPRLRHLLGQLDRAFAGPGEQSWAKFRDRYIQAVGAWLANVREKASNENRRLLRDFEANLQERTVFSARQKELLLADTTWASKAVLTLLEESNLTSVLVGLRKKEQVDEVLAPLKIPASPQGETSAQK